jgi:hypothetical protein
VSKLLICNRDATEKLLSCNGLDANFGVPVESA